MSTQQPSHTAACGQAIYNDGGGVYSWEWHAGLSATINVIAPGHVRLDTDGTGGLFHPSECLPEVTVYVEEAQPHVNYQPSWAWFFNVSSGLYQLEVFTRNAADVSQPVGFSVVILRKN